MLRLAAMMVPMLGSACVPGENQYPFTEDDRRLYAPTAADYAKGTGLMRSAYRSQDDVARVNAGCVSCHGATDAATMHASELQVLVSCIDCHGGSDGVGWKMDAGPQNDGHVEDSSEYNAIKAEAHGVRPRFPEAWTAAAGQKAVEAFPSAASQRGLPPAPRGSAATGGISSANPVRSTTLLNYEDPKYIRFVNPGDLRVAHVACGQCHMDIVQRVRVSMMTHGAQLWEAAIYNNGSYPLKVARFGESYSIHGQPQTIYSIKRPSDEEIAAGTADFGRRYSPTTAEKRRGVIAHLEPLPRWEITQMGNILRAFERGGKLFRGEVPLALPDPFESPGRPDMKLSDRGLGTELSTDPVFLGLQKTRLLDPILSMLGTNDHPGDYRSSGCTACHTVYANDRSPVHAAQYASAGHLGLSQQSDPTIPKNERGHPIQHVMTRSVPSSQCIVCHVHPGTSYANSYLGFMWWDNETHGELMYPNRQRDPTAEQFVQAMMSNPEGASARGLWSNLYPGEEDHQGSLSGGDFLEDVSTHVNPKMDRAQFADFHGHGWVFKAVFKKDRKGRLLDSDDHAVASVTPDKLQAAVAFTAKHRGEKMPPGHPVHLKDIHLERGMQCVDCHFEQDVHGDGKLYSEVRNAIEIDCIDCHGTIAKRATLKSSGPAGGNDLGRLQTPFGRRFDWRGDRLIQRSTMDAKIEWEVPQIADSVDRSSPRYNPKSARAKLTQRGSGDWGDSKCPESKLAHSNSSMACYACHTAWMTSCFGCHLPMRANLRMPMLHNEGEILRNWTQYNFQVLRDDVFMLGKDTTVKGSRIVPVRSSSAVVVGSANANREWSYSQQQTISSEGYSGQAFNPHFPHAVRKTETRKCTDCHLSEENDNNAWLAQTLLQGTNLVNFLGRFVYVATGRDGFEAVVVTERDEPQAVIGSTLHELAYPDNFAKHESRGQKLTESYEHLLNDGLLPTGGEILDVQLRGEYLYTARGKAGFYAYDVANVDNKGFSERVITAPVSPLGQRLGISTKHATSVASPTTQGVDPTRRRISTNPLLPAAGMLDTWRPDHINQEQQMHPMYAFLYVSDLEEGLVIVGDAKAGVGTLLDGDPMNNFLKRGLAFNPEGKLSGAVYVTLAGHFAYVCCERGLVVVDLDNPLKPRIAAEIVDGFLRETRAIAVQFRYAFVTDADGLKVIDVTSPAQPRPVRGATTAIADAQRLYLARTYAYVAASSQGLAIVDIERPESPRLDQLFNADGEINDARDVKVGMTNASAFAYVADGANGLRVLQLTSPRTMPDFSGFSPRPQPRLIATYKTHGPALAISKGLDRDRAVDETGHQTAVFGRLGSRPLSWEEQRRLYVRRGRDGKDEVYRVRDDGSPPVHAVGSRP